MPTNKHAIIRYQALDRCFRTRIKRFYIADLLKACNQALQEFSPGTPGIKKRQLYDDIRFMKSKEGYSIKLESKRDGRDKYYYYEDPNFSINSVGLNEFEASQIKEALLVLSRFKGMPQFEWVDEITARLESSFQLKKGAEYIIDFEQNRYLRGLEHISILFNAVLNKTALKVVYKSFKSEKESEIAFHPYYLKQYNNRWFCFGKSDKAENLTNLALDRIMDIQSSKVRYIEHKIDFEEYFEDVVGVTVSGKPQIIHLKVSKDLWPYIETKPIHGSQTVKARHSDHVILQLELKVNYEFESLLLSHAEKVEIVKPLSLKTKISNRLKGVKS